ncbi:MAG: hypothetical protein KIT60_15525 [Burkholderiaceae bacterium]|nr:hypothetical protein [Burkholderiaceae bacterium]
MTEWWTYRLDSFLLFSARTYQRLIENYNADVWPLQMVALMAGVGLLLWLGRPHSPRRDRVVFVLLAFAWWWLAWGFLHRRFAPINWSADYAALLFALQGVALLWVALARRGMVRRRHLSPTDPIAITLIVIGVIVYPFIATILGRPWSQAEVFAVMPDPTVITTLGLLLLAEPPRRVLLIVPVLWCLYSGAMGWGLRAGHAWVPPAVALLAAVCLQWRRRLLAQYR